MKKRQLALLGIFLFAGLMSLVGLNVQSEPDEIRLYIQDIGLSKDHPLHIKMYMRAGDKITVKIEQERGLLQNLLKQEEIKNLFIKVDRLSSEGLTFAEETIEQATMATEGFEAKENDFYRFKMEYDRGRMLELGAVEFMLLSGTTGDTLQIENMYVGTASETQPRIAIDFQEKDYLIVNPGPRVESKVSLTIPELASFQTRNNYWNHLQKMPDGGTFTLDLKGNQSPGTDIAFRLARTRPKAQEVTAGGIIVEAEPEPTVEELLAGVEDGDDITKDMLAVIQAMLQQKTVLYPELINIPEPYLFDASPERDLTQPNRKCQEILDLDEGLFWVYWIGVGADLQDRFFPEQDKQINRYNGPPETQPETAMQLYAVGLLEGGNLTTKAKFPVKLRDPDYREEIEYAIVTEDQQAAFLREDDFQAIWANKGTARDHGNGPLQPGQRLFLCTCNHNQVSPVRVFFKHEVFDTTTIAISR